MGLAVKEPLYLLLLIPAAAYFVFAWKHTQRLAGGRKKAVFAVRAVVLLLLIAIAAGLAPTMQHTNRAVVFVADRSASMQADERLAAWIGEAVAAKDGRDLAGTVSFGSNAAVERPLSEMEDSTELRAAIETSFTDAAAGMRLAAAMLPAGGRIVLLSDGKDNDGDLMRQGRLLRERGIAVDVVPFPSAARRDAAVEALRVPSSLKLGERFAFELEVTSTFDGEAELRLYEDNVELSRQPVALSRGTNRFALQSVAAETGFRRYRAELYVPGDEQPQNDAAYGFSRIEGPPRVLVVEAEPGSSANIGAALDASLIPYDAVLPEMLSAELAAYAQYDAIVLHNVPATRLSEGVMERLASAAGDLGIGLLAAGGPDSYGVGGYYGTPLERALPVYMDLRGRRQMPSLGLVLVIDRSGSMDGGKLELAKEAALRTVELLREQDTVGVIAFDDAPWWVVEPTTLDDRDAVMTAIRGIQPAGGTDIQPAVASALARMLEIGAERRHIILLTDGMSAGYAGYDGLTQRMVDEGITMSTVAVGQDADTALLSRLAEAAKGRYYFTNDQSTIPAIFSREAVLMSRTYIVELPFVPAVGQAGQWAGLFAEGVPELDGYVATTAKETAEQVLLSPEGDPVLARWQYGAGRTVAWTSDLEGRWSSKWAAWPAFPDVLAAWVKWTFPQFTAEPYAVTAEPDGSAARLLIRAEDGTLAANVAASVTREDGSRQSLKPVPVAPGTYEARMEAAEPGVYLMRIGEDEGGGADGDEQGGDSSGDGSLSVPVSGALAGFVIPYSPEYRLGTDDAAGEARLAELAALTGGRVLDPERPAEAYDVERIVVRETVDLSRALLIAALLLWLTDIALRRISVPWRRLAAALARRLPGARRTAAGVGAAPGAGDAAAAMARLQQRKQRAGRFYAGDAARPEPPLPQAGAGEAAPVPGRQDAGRASAPSAAEPQQQGAAPSAGADAARGSGSGAAGGAAGSMDRLLAAKRRGRR